MTTTEMAAFIDNESLYRGLMNIRYRGQDGLLRSGGNLGAYVARHQEPSLMRLVHELLEGVPPNEHEQRIQRVLDFVSYEIGYDHAQAELSVEKMERPNEVLMRGKTDCGNKAVLFASLLEQMDENYLIVYMPNIKHATIAVEKRGFETPNEYVFTWDNTEWTLAEPTALGFQIGSSTLLDSGFRLEDITLVQRPWIADHVYNFQTGKQIDMRTTSNLPLWKSFLSRAVSLIRHYVG